MLGRNVAIVRKWHARAFPAQRIHDAGETLSAGKQILIEFDPRRVRRDPTSSRSAIEGALDHRPIGLSGTRPSGSHSRKERKVDLEQKFVFVVFDLKRHSAPRLCSKARRTPALREQPRGWHKLSKNSVVAKVPNELSCSSSRDLPCLNGVRGFEQRALEDPVKRPHGVLRMRDLDDGIALFLVEGKNGLRLSRIGIRLGDYTAQEGDPSAPVIVPRNREHPIIVLAAARFQIFREKEIRSRKQSMIVEKQANDETTDAPVAIENLPTSNCFDDERRSSNPKSSEQGCADVASAAAPCRRSAANCRFPAADGRFSHSCAPRLAVCGWLALGRPV